MIARSKLKDVATRGYSNRSVVKLLDLINHLEVLNTTNTTDGSSCWSISFKSTNPTF